MKVEDFIEKLKALGTPDYTVKLADWNEAYRWPNEKAAEDWRIDNEKRELIIGEKNDS